MPRTFAACSFRSSTSNQSFDRHSSVLSKSSLRARSSNLRSCQTFNDKTVTHAETMGRRERYAFVESSAHFLNALKACVLPAACNSPCSNLLENEGRSKTACSTLMSNPLVPSGLAGDQGCVCYPTTSSTWVLKSQCGKMDNDGYLIEGVEGAAELG